MRNKIQLEEYLIRDLRSLEIDFLMESPYPVMAQISEEDLIDALSADQRSDAQMKLAFMLFASIEIKGTDENFGAPRTDEAIVAQAEQIWKEQYAD